MRPTQPWRRRARVLIWLLGMLALATGSGAFTDAEAMPPQHEGRTGRVAAASAPRTIPVTVAVGPDQFLVYTAAARVGELLAELGIRPDADDRVEPGPEALLEPGTRVRVVLREEEWVTREVEVPFAVVRREDPTLPLGQTREVQPGQRGRKEIRIRRIWENGRLISEQAVSERLVQPPVNRVVAVGTVGVVARGGVEYRYRAVYDMIATAYAPGDGSTPGTLTATGIPARKGVVAVDPRVIPLGTRLYVEGYGPAVAADTGGKIKGNRIDLAFDTPDEARRFGVRRVRVYVLVK